MTKLPTHRWTDRKGFIEAVYLRATGTYAGKAVEVSDIMDSMIASYCQNVDLMGDRVWERARKEIIWKIEDSNSRKDLLGKPEKKVNII